MFKEVRTLAVYVSDLGRARKFYEEALGLKFSHEIGPNINYLVSESGKVAIYLEGGMKARQADSQSCRLGFFLETEDSVGAAFEALKKAGVTLLQDAPEQVSDDLSCFQFQDPDGNIIDVVGRS